MEVNDEAAEREHCEQACEEHFGHSLGLWPNGPDLLMRERFAVRAPLQAEIERLKAWSEHVEKIAQLPASQDIIELAIKLSEAQAEIERLKAVQTTQSLRIDLIRILAEKWKGRIYPASWAQAASELGGELRAEVLTGEPSRATSGLLTQACIKMQVKLGKLKDETEWLRQRCIALENGKDDNARSPAAGQLETNLSEAQVEIERLSKQVQELEQECGEHVSYENVLLRRAQAAEKQVQELQQEIADRDRWDDDDGRIYPEDPK